MVQLIYVLLLCLLHHGLGVYIKWNEDDTIWYVKRNTTTKQAIIQTGVDKLECSDDGKRLYVCFERDIFEVDVATGIMNTIATVPDRVTLLHTDRSSADLYYNTIGGEVRFVSLGQERQSGFLFNAHLADMDIPPNTNSARIYFVNAGDWYLYFFDKLTKKLNIWFNKFRCDLITFSEKRVFIYTHYNGMVSYDHDLRDKTVILSYSETVSIFKDVFYRLRKGEIWLTSQKTGIHLYHVDSRRLEKIVDCVVVNCDYFVYDFCTDVTDSEHSKVVTHSDDFKPVIKAHTTHESTDIPSTNGTTSVNPSILGIDIQLAVIVPVIGVSIILITILCIYLWRRTNHQQQRDRTASSRDSAGCCETNQHGKQPTKTVSDCQQVDNNEEGHYNYIPWLEEKYRYDKIGKTNESVSKAN